MNRWPTPSGHAGLARAIALFVDLVAQSGTVPTGLVPRLSGVWVLPERYPVEPTPREEP
jgi:hypothetical protein